MATATKERTTSAADRLQAAREQRDAARRAHDEAQQRAGRAVRLVQQGGPDRLEVLRAREEAVSLERAEIETERALEQAEGEYQVALAAYGRERAAHYRPIVRNKSRELDAALEHVRILTAELAELGAQVRRDGAADAYDRELAGVGAQVVAQLPTWRHRVRAWLAD